MYPLTENCRIIKEPLGAELYGFSLAVVAVYSTGSPLVDNIDIQICLEAFDLNTLMFNGKH